MPCSYCGSKFRYIGTTNVIAELSHPLRINVFVCDKCNKVIAMDATRKKSKQRVDKMPRLQPRREMELTPEEIRIREKNKMTDKELEQYIKECKVDKS